MSAFRSTTPVARVVALGLALVGVAIVAVVYARSTRRDGTAYAVRGEGLRNLAR